MIKNYIIVALRNLRRFKGYSFINITGLAIGMAVCLVIVLWVENELSYDRFHTHADHVYRIMSYGTKYFQKGIDGTPGPLAPAIQKEVPGIKQAVRLADLPPLVFKSGDTAFYELRGLAVDPSFFELFSFPLKKGGGKQVFSGPVEIVISGPLAKKYFGSNDPLNQSLNIEGKLFRITGVLKDIPPNSHIKFDFLINFTDMEKMASWGQGWGSFNFVTYIRLEPGARPEHIAGRITRIADRYECPQVKDGVQFRLQPLRRIHLDPRGSYRNYIDLTDGKYVTLFSIIVLFVMMIACINFINLSTARSILRIKEVSIRKTLGSNRKQLIKQFLGEALLLCMAALALGVFLAELFLPVVNRISGKSLDLNYADPGHWGILVAIFLLAGILSGSYPAFYLSSFHPVSVLKKSSHLTGRSGLRKVLVTGQFVVGVILIINTLAVDSQLQYIQNKNLGFEKNNLIYIPIKYNMARNYGIFKQKLMNDSNVNSVTAVHYLFPFVFPRTTAYDWEGKTPGQDSDMLINAVDYDFFKTLNINILSGRTFSKMHADDKTGAYILNEEAVAKMGVDSPVGKRFSYNQRKGTIIGVMENVYFKSLHQRIEPQVFLVSEDFSEATQYGAVLINAEKGRTTEALEVIKKNWESINPNLPFEYHFLDQAYANLYRGEKTIRSLLNYFTLLAILVSCLGLAGLASFMTRQKTKEIGIRKVCGASLNKIVRLIVFQYIKWVILAIVIAWPVSFLLMGQWLKQFAYRFTPGPVIFLLSALAVILFALVTVGYQAFKAASANPVEALRYE